MAHAAVLLKQPDVVDEMLGCGFVELAIDPLFLRPHARIIWDGMQRITDRTELGAKFPWERNFFVDEYGDKYPQEIGLDNSTNNGENKWKFHYQPDAYIGRADINGCAHGAFLQALRNIDRETKRITLMVAGAFDERNETEGWYDGSLTKRLNGGNCITRVLRYLKRSSHDAYPHIDRSLFSVHFMSSHPGLVLFDKNGERCRIAEMQLNSIAVFPGEKFAAATRGRLGYGTMHGVRYDRTNDDDDRFSMVSFMHPEAKPEDCAWLNEHREEIQAYEKNFAL